MPKRRERLLPTDPARDNAPRLRRGVRRDSRDGWCCRFVWHVANFFQTMEKCDTKLRVKRGGVTRMLLAGPPSAPYCGKAADGSESSRYRRSTRVRLKSSMLLRSRA